MISFCFGKTEIVGKRIAITHNDLFIVENKHIFSSETRLCPFERRLCFNKNLLRSFSEIYRSRTLSKNH